MTEPSQGGPDLWTLLNLFGASDDVVAGHEFVAPDQVPPPYHDLLVHEHHMTVTVEAHHGDLVDVWILERWYSGDFYANTNAPSVPSSLGVIGIAGLNSFEGPRLSRRTAASPAARPVTIGPATDTGLTAPTDLWSIYDQPANNKGEGQKMAIFGWGTTKNTLTDLRQFEVQR